MIPVQFSESVSVANVMDYGLNRFISLCDQKPGRRVKEEVNFGKVLDSVGFADSVYCYIDSTKRRFRSTVFYEPKYCPKGFSETYYILPRHTSLSCESTREYHPNKVTRRWYSTSLAFGPKEFKSGISVVGSDDVFTEPEIAAPGKTGTRKELDVGSGRHLSTIEVNVTATSPAADDIAKTSDRNNNIMAGNSYTIRYRNGDIRATPDDEVVFRSAVKVLGNCVE